MHIGRLLGARLKISPFLIIFLITFSLIGMLEQALLLFIIVLLHELAHTAASRAVGIVIREIELLPFGGVAQLEGYPELDPKVEVIISWAGPLLNFIFAALAMYFYFSPHSLFTKSRSLFFIEANLTMAFFNLIPALPLDGGRILRAQVSSLLGFRRATVLAADFGMVAGLIMAAVGIWLYISGNGINISLIMISLFLFVSAYKEKKMNMYAYMHFLNVKRADLQRNQAMAVSHVVAFDETPLQDVLKLFSPRHYHIVLVIDRQHQVIRKISEKQLLEAAFKNNITLPLRRVK